MSNDSMPSRRCRFGGDGGVLTRECGHFKDGPRPGAIVLDFMAVLGEKEVREITAFIVELFVLVEQHEMAVDRDSRVA